MKKLIAIFSLCGLLVSYGCQDEDYASASNQYAAIETADATESVTEDSDEPITIPVTYGGTITNPSAFTVNYTVTGGTYGTDYTIVGGSSANGTLTIPAGSDPVASIEILPVADLVTESNVELTITLQGTSTGYNVGYPGGKSIVVTIEDDDCEYLEADYEGEAGGHEFYSDGSEYPDSGTDYPVNFTITGEHELTMDNYWGSGYVVKLTIDPTTLAITVPAQTLEDGSTVVGTGKLSTCGKLITIQTVLVTGGDTYDFKNTYQFPVPE